MKKIFTVLMLSISAISYAQYTHIEVVQQLNKNGFPKLTESEVIINSFLL